MSIWRSVLFAVGVLAFSSCHSNREYESQLIQRAKSITTTPVTRSEFLERLEVDDVYSVTEPTLRRELPVSDAVVYVETWRLKNGYILQASAEAAPSISAESLQNSERWRKTASEREFYILEHDHIESFASFEILSSTGRRIYPENLRKED